MKTSAVLIVFCLPLFIGCQNTTENRGFYEYDFDHGVHFELTALEGGRYHVLVEAKDDIRFNRLATFLLRKSYSLCQSYGFKIEVLDGVEEFDDSVAKPNLITPSLSANVECPCK